MKNEIIVTEEVRAKAQKACHEVNASYELVNIFKEPESDGYFIIAQKTKATNVNNCIVWNYRDDREELYWGHYDIRYPKALQYVTDQINSSIEMYSR